MTQQAAPSSPTIASITVMNQCSIIARDYPIPSGGPSTSRVGCACAKPSRPATTPGRSVARARPAPPPPRPADAPHPRPPRPPPRLQRSKDGALVGPAHAAALDDEAAVDPDAIDVLRRGVVDDVLDRVAQRRHAPRRALPQDHVGL